MFETLFTWLLGVGLVGAAAMQHKDPTEAVDLGQLARDLENDPTVLKAQAEVVASKKAVRQYHEVCGQVLSGKLAWSDGSHNVSTKLPDELDSRVTRAHAKLAEARRRAFTRLAAPRCDALLEDDRRRVERTWACSFRRWRASMRTSKPSGVSSPVACRTGVRRRWATTSPARRWQNGCRGRGPCRARSDHKRHESTSENSSRS